MSKKYSGFFPNTDIKEYSYRRSLLYNLSPKYKENGTAVIDALNEAHSSISSIEFQSIVQKNLQDLYEAERTKEKNFLLNELELKNIPSLQQELNEPEKVGQFLIQVFNQTFGDLTIIQNTINEIKNKSINEEGLRNETSIYTFLNDVLPSVIVEATEKLVTDITKNENGEKVIKEITNENVTEELIKYIGRVLKEKIENGKGNFPNNPIYTELLNYIGNLKRKSVFLEPILEKYGLSEAKIEKIIDSSNNLIDNLKLIQEALSSSVKARSAPGNAFEILMGEIGKKIVTEIVKDKKFSSVSTGGTNQMKADWLYTFGIDKRTLNNALKKFYKKAVSMKKNVTNEKGEVIAEKESSIRLQNIEGFQAFLQALNKKTGSIVLVSDKNYKLNSKTFAEDSEYYGGFGGDNIKLNTAQKIFTKSNVNIDSDSLINLFFILSNSGYYLINNKNYEDAKQLMISYIGSFLFDDINIVNIINSKTNNINNINIIHLFLLNGIYIPFSCFLEALCKALEKMDPIQYNKYIKIAIDTPNTSYQNDGQLEKTDWEKYHEQVLEKYSLEVSFFGDFLSYVEKELSSVTF